MRDACFYRWSATLPILRCGASSASPNFETYIAYAHPVWETVTRFCMVIKLDDVDFFAGSTTPYAPLRGQNICDMNADALGPICLLLLSCGTQKVQLYFPCAHTLLSPCWNMLWRGPKMAAPKLGRFVQPNIATWCHSILPSARSCTLAEATKLFQYFMNGHQLATVTEERDLGVQLTSDMKPSRQ